MVLRNLKDHGIAGFWSLLKRRYALPCFIIISLHCALFSGHFLYSACFVVVVVSKLKNGLMSAFYTACIENYVLL